MNIKTKRDRICNRVRIVFCIIHNENYHSVKMSQSRKTTVPKITDQTTILNATYKKPSTNKIKVLTIVKLWIMVKIHIHYIILIYIARILPHYFGKTLSFILKLEGKSSTMYIIWCLVSSQNIPYFPILMCLKHAMTVTRRVHKTT